MAKNKENEKGETEFSSIQVTRKTLKMLQIISAWKHVTMRDYLDHLVLTYGAKDLEEAKKGIDEFLS